MTDPERWVVTLGLVLFIGGLAGSLTYTQVVNHRTYPELTAQFGQGFERLARGEPTEARREMMKAKLASYRHVRASDAKTHLLKVSALVILVGVLLPLIPWSSRTIHWSSGILLVGTVLFPLGLFWEVFSRALIPQLVAGLGALMVFLSFSGFLYGIYQATTGRDSIVS